MRSLFLLLAAPLGAAALSAATSPVKVLPPTGIVLPEGEKTQLQAACDHLEAGIQALSGRPGFEAAEPDMEVFRKAVTWSLDDGTFYSEKQVAYAKSLLQEGEARVSAFARGQRLWLEEEGTVLRGYRSVIDDSVQPFVLTIPQGIASSRSVVHPSLVWLLGRGEERTEVGFFQELAGKPAQMAPAGVIVIHPYGRFCNATKFAGEADVFEAIHATLADYDLNPDKMGLGGFSMGGASVWHLAVHHSGLWCVATPGAGFAETPIYTRALEPGKPPRYPWEVTLWHEYDALGCAANLSNVRTIAYSGEIDPQRQSADLMEKAMAADGLTLERLIGPHTAHKYEPETKKVLDARVAEAIAKGRNPIPAQAWLQTYTLRYPTAAWLRADLLQHHWERAEIKAAVDTSGLATVTTQNVAAFSILRPGVHRIVVNGQAVDAVPGPEQALALQHGAWGRATAPQGLVKRHGLTGPVDDAFVSPFLFVLPTGHSAPRVDAWVADEVSRARVLWHRVFRGEVPCRNDVDLTAQEVATHNIVLWGDAASNTVIARIASRLPLSWSAGQLELAGKDYDASRFVPILVYPNPEAPRHYVVLNSGIDFRDEAYGTNALQTPKLPDWSVIELSGIHSGRWPGGIADAGFFDETWSHPASAMTAN